MKQKEIKTAIAQLVKEYYDEVHASTQNSKFAKGDRINYAGRVFNETEMINLLDASLEFWLTSGRFCKEFEDKLTAFLGIRHALLVNSGSSANLLAFMALTSPLLAERKINRGDEVITVAAGFPTTVAPVIQYGAIPVFVDVELETGNIDCSQLENAASPKTKAVMLAHTLGNPFDIDTVKAFCEKYKLWLIEDNCDALGSKYKDKHTGTFGDIGTSSFYPPHHITMGEGGAAYTNNPTLGKIMRSIRDWGRDCWCDSGKDNTCGCRFEKQYGSLPKGYDHKYVYSHFGYNLKATEMQAAIGCAQLDKLSTFIEKRKQNYNFLHDALKSNKNLIIQKTSPDSDPSWFGFMITVNDNAPFTRNELAQHLEKKNIQTRPLFAGNITKHPCFNPLDEGKDYRIAGNHLPNTDRIMNNSLWIGVYPGITKEKLEYMVDAIRTYNGSMPPNATSDFNVHNVLTSSISKLGGKS